MRAYLVIGSKDPVQISIADRFELRAWICGVVTDAPIAFARRYEHGEEITTTHSSATTPTRGG